MASQCHVPWYSNPSCLFLDWTVFFPRRGMTPADFLNASVRFILYASILIAVYRNEYMPFVYGILIIGLLSIIYAPKMHHHDPAPTHTHAQKDNFCTRPSKTNPFMNVLPHEFTKDKPAACPSTPDQDDEVNTYFEHGLVREISDPYKKRASDRQFMTMPVTSSIPDTQAFRNYVFENTADGPRCKR